MKTHDDFDYIINDYLQPFDQIHKSDIDYLSENFDKTNVKHFKIINNNLYIDKIIYKNKIYLGWETRIEAFKYMLLQTLKNFKINDVEFVMYDDDGINETNIGLYTLNNRILPVIISTSVLDKYNFILCPDFTFSFCPEYSIRNNQKMCNEVVSYQENICFENKINRLIYRASANNEYRSSYICSNDIYDIKNVTSNTNVRGGLYKPNNPEDYFTYLQKSNYKYILHLNGHLGNSCTGAYSSAFKWGLMCKSVVFYSASAFYREFWQHNKIFRENEHFVYTHTPSELHNKYCYYINNQNECEVIANNGFNFFKKYLLDYENITYYMYKLLNEYHKKQTFTPIITSNDELITNIKECQNIDI